jgi:hypothetical protein
MRALGSSGRCCLGGFQTGDGHLVAIVADPDGNGCGPSVTGLETGQPFEGLVASNANFDRE